MSHHFELPPEIDWKVRQWIRQHKRGLRLCLLMAIPVAILLCLGILWGLFAGASYLKSRVAKGASAIIPVSWEQQLGSVALAQIKTQVRMVNDPQLMESLRRVADPLLNSISNKPYPFILYIADAKEINAFALPGGHIVFNRGLLEWAKTPEEIQGVLAHEAAHVLKRHSLLQLAQNLGFDLAISQIQGNETRYLDALIKDGSKLVSMKFSRDHERAADDLGWELLQKAQINPGGMVDFFIGLQSANKARGELSLTANLLSTHPTPQERIDRLEQKKGTITGQSFKTFEAEFKSLREGLFPTLERMSHLLQRVKMHSDFSV